MIVYYGEDSRHQYGLAFIVRKEVVGSIISFTPISSRFVSIGISARPYNITHIQVHASTSDHKDEEIEQFYEQLDSIIAKTPTKDRFVAQSDWIAKVGPGGYQYWAGTVGRFGIGDKRQRMETPRVCKEPSTHPSQHSPPQQVVHDSNLAYP